MGRRHLMGLVLVGVMGGLLALAFGATAEKNKADDEMLKECDRFLEILHLVQKQYVREVDTKELFEGAIRGMLSELDPFSNYVPESEMTEFKKTMLGKFGGIGIQIGMRQGFLTVISPIEGTPAFEAGVLAGDLILEIDGKSTEGMTLDDAIKVLTGDPGTKVTIKVRHMTGEVVDIPITRAIIEVHTVKGIKRDADDHWVYMIDPDKKIAYIRVTQFVDNTVPDLKVALDGLVKDGMKGLILDLRFNPGGILQGAVETCDMFLDEGVIVQTRGRTTPHWEATATKAGTYPYFPMVVLVNQFSASASEIVSGCLQDHGRAIVVGDRSFGKGSVQNIIPLEGEQAALKLTTSKYYMPSGRNIHREEDMTAKDEWGVVPDVEVPMTPLEYVAILKARQEGEIIHHGNGNGNGKKDEKPAAESETPKTPAAAPESEEEPGLEEMPGTVPPESPDVKTPAAKGEPVRDRQLERALDLLRSMEVLEKYMKHMPPAPAAAEPSRKAA